MLHEHDPILLLAFEIVSADDLQTPARGQVDHDFTISIHIAS